MKKEAIAVYDPQDNWERAIQNAAKDVTGDWLPWRPCQLLAAATVNLKCDNGWLEEEDLLPIRAYYLFAPEMTENREEYVFVTHALYLRDILENHEINCVLHNPAAFLAPPLATFLFRECPVHIHIKNDLLRAANRKVEFIEVGGVLIAEKQDIYIDENIISRIECIGNEAQKAIVDNITMNITPEPLQFQKSAAKEIAFDIFSNDEAFSAIKPGGVVWDKMRRINANINEIEPGETGFISIDYGEGEVKRFTRQEFDCQFMVV